jgi:hypothetical protein
MHPPLGYARHRPRFTSRCFHCLLVATRPARPPQTGRPGGQRLVTEAAASQEAPAASKAEAAVSAAAR